MTEPKSAEGDMGNWLTYFKERFPLGVYTTLVAGFAASGTLLGGGRLFGLTFWVAFFGLMVFFALLRTMDEVKDYEKDLVANPTRPLPRGLLKVDTVKTAIAGTAVFMALYGVALLYFSRQASLTYLFLTFWLWLMYREFYLGEWLEKRQLLYATTHQFVLVPVSILAAVLANPLMFFRDVTWLYAGVVVGAFFSYEVCRKLDPGAHPLLRTYRSLYGVGGCFAIVTVTSLVASVSAYHLRMAWLIPFSALLLASFPLLGKGKHKIVEAVASVSLVVHIWSIVLVHLKEWL